MGCASAFRAAEPPPGHHRYLRYACRAGLEPAGAARTRRGRGSGGEVRLQCRGSTLVSHAVWPITEF